MPSEEIIAIVLRGQQDPVLEPYVEFAASAYVTIEPGQLGKKLELNGRAMRFSPKDMVVYRQALLRALDGRAEAPCAFIRAFCPASRQCCAGLWPAILRSSRLC